jgi:hypothetical protein
MPKAKSNVLKIRLHNAGPGKKPRWCVVEGGVRMFASTSRDVAEAWVRAQEEMTAQTRDRACMRCRQTFCSTGPHHRMCEECRAIDTPTEYIGW